MPEREAATAHSDDGAALSHATEGPNGADGERRMVLKGGLQPRQRAKVDAVERHLHRHHARHSAPRGRGGARAQRRGIVQHEELGGGHTEAAGGAVLRVVVVEKTVATQKDKRAAIHGTRTRQQAGDVRLHKVFEWHRGDRTSDAVESDA